MRYVKRLYYKERNILKRIVKYSMNIRVRQRAHVIILSSKNYSINQLSEIFDVNRDTISRWIESWEKSGLRGLFDTQRSGRPKSEIEDYNDIGISKQNLKIG